jgi:hypothetical protein
MWKPNLKEFKFNQVVFIAFIFFGCSEPVNITNLTFPSDIEMVYDRKEPCFNCDGDIIFYLDGTKHSLYVFTNATIHWQKFAQEYPELDVKIYLANKLPKGNNSLSEVITFFEKTDFPYRVYWDPGNIFYETNKLDNVPNENKTFQIYLVKENQVLCSHDFGIPSLREKQLEQHFGMKPVRSNP